MLPFGLRVKKKRERRKKKTTVFVTCPKQREKMEVGVRRVGDASWAGWGHRTEGAKLSTPGTIAGLWKLRFCARRRRQVLQWNFHCHTPEMEAHHIGHGCWSCHVNLSFQIHDAWASLVDITGKIANS